MHVRELAYRWLTSPARRVVEFGAPKSAKTEAKTAYDKHPAVGQERRGVGVSRPIEAASSGPRPGSRIVEFRARERVGIAACDEHLAVGQQRCRMISACVGEAACGRPGAARWIVEFGARERAEVAAHPAFDEDPAISQWSRLSIFACYGHAAGLLKLKGKGRAGLHEHQRQANYE